MGTIRACFWLGRAHVEAVVEGLGYLHSEEISVRTLRLCIAILVTSWPWTCFPFRHCKAAGPAPACLALTWTCRILNAEDSLRPSEGARGFSLTAVLESMASHSKARRTAAHSEYGSREIRPGMVSACRLDEWYLHSGRLSPETSTTPPWVSQGD